MLFHDIVMDGRTDKVNKKIDVTGNMNLHIQTSIFSGSQEKYTFSLKNGQALVKEKLCF